MLPRETYGHCGPEEFGDIELVALVIGTGIAGRSAVEIAAEILHRFGGLAGISRAAPAELGSVNGVGLARAVRLHAGLEAGRRSVRREAVGEAPVRTPADAFARLGPALRGLRDEELHVLLLDRRRRPLAVRRLTRGSDAFTVVDPRQVYREALSQGAAAVVLGHNHPSGDPEPSVQDREVTRRVAAAGRMLGVPLLDHLVVGSPGWTSLAEEGEIQGWSDPTPSWVASD
jgi:DNA repair protein RadC